MMLLCCHMLLLLCLSANAENTAVWGESGESVTLECSIAGCVKNFEGYVGMYLYHTKLDHQVLYYHPNVGSEDRITPGSRYTKRIQTKGSLANHTVTISNLTVDDSGVYRCVYKKFPPSSGVAQCQVYSLAVRGAVPCSGSEIEPCACANEKGLPLVLIVIATCVISTLVTTIFILIVTPRVKQCTRRTRRTASAPLASNDYIYEVMTKDGLRPQSQRP